MLARSGNFCSFPILSLVRWIFSAAETELEGTITGFDQPEGMCADRAGNVWVADGNRLYEYSHSGVLLDEPIRLSGQLLDRSADGTLALDIVVSRLPVSDATVAISGAAD